jgi:hypothetical protein
MLNIDKFIRLTEKDKFKFKISILSLTLTMNIPNFRIRDTSSMLSEIQECQSGEVTGQWGNF